MTVNVNEIHVNHNRGEMGPSSMIIKTLTHVIGESSHAQIQKVMSEGVQL